jgi:hypothetical protein
MEVAVDADVKAVAEFMEKSVPAGKLMGVANRLSQISSLLWGHFEVHDDVKPLRLVRGADPQALNIPQPSATGPLAASELSLPLRCADGCSEWAISGL